MKWHGDAEAIKRYPAGEWAVAETPLHFAVDGRFFLTIFLGPISLALNRNRLREFSSCKDAYAAVSVTPNPPDLLLEEAGGLFWVCLVTLTKQSPPIGFPARIALVVLPVAPLCGRLAASLVL